MQTREKRGIVKDKGFGPLVVQKYYIKLTNEDSGVLKLISKPYYSIL